MKTKQSKKLFKLFFGTFLSYLILLFIAISMTYYFSLFIIFNKLIISSKSNTFLQNIFNTNITYYYLLISCGVFIILGLFFWFSIKRIIKNHLLQQNFTIKKPTNLNQAVEIKKNSDNNKRLFFHLVSVLQSQGRLLDFLSEDLSAYDDAQVGVAVRSIHENCKSVIEKNLSPKPIMQEQEGEKVTILENLDSDSIKLTGNVTGQPPFTGILRHKGWKAKKLNLPTFTGSKDESIIYPAEVEIE